MIGSWAMVQIMGSVFMHGALWRDRGRFSSWMWRCRIRFGDTRENRMRERP